MCSTPTRENVRFFGVRPTLNFAQSELPNWLAGGLTWALCLEKITSPKKKKPQQIVLANR